MWYRHDQDEIATWKNALHQVSSFFGWLKETTSKYKGQLVKRVVSDVLNLKMLSNVPLDVLDHPVGLHSLESRALYLSATWLRYHMYLHHAKKSRELCSLLHHVRHSMLHSRDQSSLLFLHGEGTSDTFAMCREQRILSFAFLLTSRRLMSPSLLIMMAKVNVSISVNNAQMISLTMSFAIRWHGY
eukprot:Gb_25030 [translate_table: standard]